MSYSEDIGWQYLFTSMSLERLSRLLRLVHKLKWARDGCTKASEIHRIVIPGIWDCSWEFVKDFYLKCRQTLKMGSLEVLPKYYQTGLWTFPFNIFFTDWHPLSKVFPSKPEREILWVSWIPKLASEQISLPSLRCSG